MKPKYKKETNTLFNYDVLQSKNVSIAKLFREELVHLAVPWLEDLSFIGHMENVNSFVEKRKYRNLYEGYSKLTYPYFDISGTKMRYRYDMHTSATSGSLRSPWFGEKFDAKKFKSMVYYAYRIYYPLDIWNSPSGTTLVLDFQVDVFGSKDKLFYGFHENEIFENTGNISISRRVPIKYVNGDQWVDYERNLDQTSSDKRHEKRESGFALDWYYEDAAGKRINFEPDKQYLNDNKEFIRFVNLFYQAVSVHNISMEKIWETVKNYRFEYKYKLMDNDKTYNYYEYIDYSEYYIDHYIDNDGYLDHQF